MSDSEPISPRARLQQLQAIPERQRTDAEWDELNELEIMLHSGNRQGGPNPNYRQQGPMSSGSQQQHRQGGGQQRPGGGQQHRGQRSGRKFHQRPPKQR
ncbi:MAG TPA: hypothetical protein VJQ51_13285 [Burkholderiales bacterium]|nr:hypothetical protein [Burkholderiales bacterium]